MSPTVSLRCRNNKAGQNKQATSTQQRRHDNTHHTATPDTRTCNNTRRPGRKKNEENPFNSNVTDFVAPMRERQSRAKQAGNNQATTQEGQLTPHIATLATHTCNNT
jgi:hypothetical protein